MKLIQLNIDGDKHLEEVFAFLEYERPDVVCLQEILAPDLTGFAHTLGMHQLFAPTTQAKRTTLGGQLEKQGVGILSRAPLQSVKEGWYFGGTGNLPTFVESDRETMWQILLSAQTTIANVPYNIGTTHFIKSLEKKPDVLQRTHMPRLLRALGAHTDLLCAGDFAFPRGNELYRAVAEQFTDLIPAEYTSSLDPKLHAETENKEMMVDYVWATPHYEASEVHMTCGLSDHCAVVAEVLRVKN